ncbi:MAG: hypothetical protein Q7T33_06450 [Dehalococcoidia bacterium]|nr:hypothetical protein [Dehalococcoidia bacterium]
MSEQTGYICDLCKRKLDERPVLFNFPDSCKEDDKQEDGVNGRPGLYFYWPSNEDICPACQRKMWLALGRERGWRVTPQRPAKAPSVPAVAAAKASPSSETGKGRKRAAHKDTPKTYPCRFCKVERVEFEGSTCTSCSRPATEAEAKAVTGE